MWKVDNDEDYDNDVQTTDKAPLNLWLRWAKTHDHTFMNIENIINSKLDLKFCIFEGNCRCSIVKMLKMWKLWHISNLKYNSGDGLVFFQN